MTLNHNYGYSNEAVAGIAGNAGAWCSCRKNTPKTLN